MYEAAGSGGGTALAGGVGAVFCLARAAWEAGHAAERRRGRRLLERALAQIRRRERQRAVAPRADAVAVGRGGGGGRRRRPRGGGGGRAAYLTITRDQTVRDLSTAACSRRGRGPAPPRGRAAERAATLLDVKRVLKLGDANRPAEASEPQAGCHTILALKLGERGLLIFASLAASDMVGPPASAEGGGEGELFSRRSPLAASFSALGRCLEAMASDGESAPPVMDCTLTATLAQALGAVPNAFTTLLLTAHPHRQKLPLTTHAMTFGQLGVSSVARARLGAGIDYASLAAQLMAQRDSKQEALYSMEKRVLAELRPELEGVMRVEGDIRALMARLHSMQGSVDVRG